MMTKASKNKWKDFKKTLRRMEKRPSMEHQNPTLWVVVKRRGTNLGSKSFERFFFEFSTIYVYIENWMYYCLIY